MPTDPMRKVTVTVHLPHDDGHAYVSIVGTTGAWRTRREYARLRARSFELTGTKPRGVPDELWLAWKALDAVVEHYADAAWRDQ